MSWNKHDFDKLKAAGKIRGYQLTTEKWVDPLTGGRKVAKHFSRKSKGLDYISWNLLYWCNEKGLIMEEEYKFNPERNWRFDFAIPSLKIAVEFEGGIFTPGTSHNSPKTFTKDSNKYNSASILGWKVLRFTAMNYKELTNQLNQIL
jgi:very-short-patch-repair endonuclease